MLRCLLFVRAVRTGQRGAQCWPFAAVACETTIRAWCLLAAHSHSPSDGCRKRHVPVGIAGRSLHSGLDGPIRSVRLLYDSLGKNGRCTAEEIETRWVVVSRHLPEICCHPHLVDSMLRACASVDPLPKSIVDIAVAVVEEMCRCPHQVWDSPRSQHRLAWILYLLARLQVVTPALKCTVRQVLSFESFVDERVLRNAVQSLLKLNIGDEKLARSASHQYQQIPHVARWRAYSQFSLLEYSVLSDTTSRETLPDVDWLGNFLRNIPSGNLYLVPLLDYPLGKEKFRELLGKSNHFYHACKRRREESPAVLANVLGQDICAAFSVVDEVPVGEMALLDSDLRFLKTRHWPRHSSDGLHFFTDLAREQGFQVIALDAISSQGLLRHPCGAPSGYRVLAAKALKAAGCCYVPVRQLGTDDQGHQLVTVIPELAIHYPNSIAPFNQWTGVVD